MFCLLNHTSPNHSFYLFCLKFGKIQIPEKRVLFDFFNATICSESKRVIFIHQTGEYVSRCLREMYVSSVQLERMSFDCLVQHNVVSEQKKQNCRLLFPELFCVILTSFIVFASNQWFPNKRTDSSKNPQNCLLT